MLLRCSRKLVRRVVWGCLATDEEKRAGGWSRQPVRRRCSSVPAFGRRATGQRGRKVASRVAVLPGSIRTVRSTVR